MTTPLLEDVVASIAPIDADALRAAEERQLQLTKPPRSLGLLEDIGNQLAAIAGACPPPIPAPALVTIFAGDHGVQAQRVSPWPQEVTAQMVANMAAGGAGGAVLAEQVGADVLIVDVGTLAPVPESERLRHRRVAAGTADLSAGPAMTLEQARTAIAVGVETAEQAIADGYRILLPGEVGIGNTTPAAALIAVFTGREASEVTGAGAGAQGETLTRKSRIVADAIASRHVRADDPLRALAEVGGFEHAAMVGLILGAASHRTPVLLDGVIACSAALVAVALAPDARGYLMAGHAGREPGIAAALATLDLVPLTALDCALGEGTGALMALPMVQGAARILRDMATFESAGVSGSDA